MNSPSSQIIFNAAHPSNVGNTYHIISGSFRSLSLFLLVFSPLNRSLSHVQTIAAFGPHQYLFSDKGKGLVYSTSWALPPLLSSWQVETSDHPNVPWRVNHINNVPITATSSYITLPPPFTHIYSTGGPTGEVHLVDSETGGFGEKVQQFLFVPESELESADKTRVALRCGSHGIEFSTQGHAFIPVLGTDSIEMYARDPATGHLRHLSSNASPRGRGDGPRHVKVHPNGKILYCVTEHTNFVDAYHIHETSLTYISSRPLLPSILNETPLTTSSSDPHTRSHFRGDTLMLSPSTSQNPAPCALLATTRGSTSNVRGWLSIFRLGPSGEFLDDIVRFETPTSGGKANALDVRAKEDIDGGMWILLTDDDDQAASGAGGGVRVLEWDGWGKGNVSVVAEWPPRDDAPQGETMLGGSHAIWLD